MKVVAFVPVKENSSRIENKNTKLLDGKPLFLHTVEKLMKCEFIDEVYVDTESKRIVELSEHTGCRFLMRDPSLANNDTDGNALYYNEIKKVDADIYVQVLCTSPFIDPETIKKGIDRVTLGDYDSSVLVRTERLYMWEEKGPIYDRDSIPNSNDLKPTTFETMGLYINDKTSLETKKRIGKKVYPLQASATEAIDVNYPEDFELAQLIASGLREKERKLFNNIKTHLNSSMLSDILDDLGINGVLKDMHVNLPVKILGRSKTLEIRELEKGEDYKGIYEALKTYDTIIPNDIIFVKNPIQKSAYFGELNANLAIRSGASGAIIDGYTRDSEEVKKLGFPVFYRGKTCQDVKRRGTVKSFNKKITIDGIEINPNDLIFGDEDGIIIMPQDKEEIILKKAFEVIKKEKNILIDICDGVDTDDIIKQNGFF